MNFLPCMCYKYQILMCWLILLYDVRFWRIWFFVSEKHHTHHRPTPDSHLMLSKDLSLSVPYATLPRVRRISSQKHEKKKGWSLFGGKKSKRWLLLNEAEPELMLMSERSPSWNEPRDQRGIWIIVLWLDELKSNRFLLRGCGYNHVPVDVEAIWTPFLCKYICFLGHGYPPSPISWSELF